MSGEYLDTSYKFDTGMLIAPIRKASVVRQIADVKTVLSPSDQQLDIETITDDFSLMLDSEPLQAKRSKQYLTKNTYDVSALSAEISYSWDELVRINSSKLPMSKRVSDLALEIADVEDALALAVTTTGVKDGGALPFLQNGTSTAFDLTSYASLKTSIGTYIGNAATTFGNLKKYALKFPYNDKFLSTALGLSNTTTDDSGMGYIDNQLKLYGGPGSGIIQAPRLGCDVAYSGETLTITNEADEACAMFVKSPDHYEIYASPYDQRPEPTNKSQGYYLKIVERWFPFVHRATSILYDIDATP